MLVLLDGGNSHSFLDEGASKWIKNQVVSSKPLTVMVANGQKISTHLKCSDVTWTMQGYKFTYNFRIMSLEVYDMILGVDWMKQFGPMIFDFLHAMV